MSDSSSTRRRALFRAAREGFEARPEERSRVDRALRHRLGAAAGALAGATTAASMAHAATGAGAGAAASGAGAGTSVTFVLAAKWVGAALVVAAVGGGGASLVLSERAASRQTATVAAPPVAGVASFAAPASSAPPAVLDAIADPPKAPPEPRLATHHPAAVPTVPSPPSPPAPATSVAAETRLLRQADQALREGDAARAINLLDDHARAYPNGVLSEERSAERVSALCKVGRVGEAKKEAARFLQTSPDSPLAGAVRSSCGGPTTGH